MKIRMIFILAIFVISISSCSNIEREINTNTDINSGIEKNEGKSSTNNSEQKEDIDSSVINEALKAENLPLTGENVFDPKNVSVGEKIMGLKLTEIEVYPATKNYPFDTVVASFSGEIILTGIIKHTEKDIESLNDKVLFIADEESTKKLPVSHHDVRKVGIPYTYILLKNQEEVKEQLNSKPGFMIENVTIKIKDYKVIYIPSTVIDSATFIELLD